MPHRTSWERHQVIVRRQITGAREKLGQSLNRDFRGKGRAWQGKQ